MIHKLHSAGLDMQIRFHTGTASFLYPSACIRRIAILIFVGLPSSRSPIECWIPSRDNSQAFSYEKNGLLGHGTPDRSSDTKKSSGTTSVDSFRQVSGRPIVGRNCSMQCRPGGEQSVSSSSNEISSDSARTAAKTSRLFDAERLQPAILFTHAHAYAMLRH